MNKTELSIKLFQDFLNAKKGMKNAQVKIRNLKNSIFLKATKEDLPEINKKHDKFWAQKMKFLNDYNNVIAVAKKECNDEFMAIYNSEKAKRNFMSFMNKSVIIDNSGIGKCQAK